MMRFGDPTPTDARSSWLWAEHQRELVERQAALRRRLRMVLAVPGLVGVALMAWAVFTYDPPNLQAMKIVAGMVLLVPWLATWQVR